MSRTRIGESPIDGSSRRRSLLRLMSASPTAALAVRLSRVIRTAAPLQDTLVFTQRRQQYTGVFR